MYYQKQKAEFAGDDNAGTRIMRAKTPLECYKIGLELNTNMDLNTWHSGPAMKAMEEGLRAKFSQNIHLCNFLLCTKGKTLVEASLKDLRWGCGVVLKDHKKLLDVAHWSGKK